VDQEFSGFGLAHWVFLLNVLEVRQELFLELDRIFIALEVMIKEEDPLSCHH